MRSDDDVPVRLNVLGRFELLSPKGEPAPLPGQKDRALLAYLGVEPGHHSRENLATLLWGSSDDRHARDSLKHALARIQRALSIIGGAGALEVGREAVRLDPAIVRTDARQLVDSLDTQDIAALRRASILYHGDLLDSLRIQSEPFYEWLLIERQRLRGAATTVLTRLLGSAEPGPVDDGQSDAARRLLSIDPAHEPACRTLMRFHDERGQAPQALQCFEALRDHLERAFATVPDRETVALRDAIRHRRQVGQTVRVSQPPPSGRHHAWTERPAVAVLPFANLSADPEQAYFCDGITDDIITDLSRFRSLLVIARQSSFSFDRRSTPLDRIARELDVSFIVEGSIRRVHDRVRVVAKLVEAASGMQLWADRFDRDLVDILMVQDEIARAVAAAVSGRIDMAARQTVSRLSPASLKSYELVLRSRFLLSEYTRPRNAEALACAEKALELDPANSRAYAHAAWCSFYDYMAGWVQDGNEALGKSLAYAEQAVWADDTDSFAHTMLGIASWFTRHFDKAEAELSLAVHLNPNDFLARRFYGLFRAATGDPTTGLNQIELGRRLNPFDTRWVPWNTGIVLFTARRYDEAIAALRRVHQPVNEVRGWLAASLAMAGRTDEARATLQHFLEIARTDMARFPGTRLRDWQAYWHAAFEFKDDAEFEHLFSALSKAGLED
jgi:TolB-like protein